MPADIIIKLRRGTAAEWVSANPILASGEAGVETDTNQLKIGDGTTVWNSLPYITGGSGAATIVSETEPAATIEGGLWYKPSTQRLYIYIEGTGWSLVPTEGIIAQTTAPGNTDVLWLDTDEPGDAVLPLAGTAGQVLAKIDGADYNTEWTDLVAADISDLTASAAELNILDGVTATASELNILDGATVTAAALNTIDDGTQGFTALSNGTAGISYQPVSHNYIINGAFDIWQRGTSFTGVTSNDYTADRWFIRFVDGTTNISREEFTPGELEIDGFGSPKYFLRETVTGSTQNQRSRIATKIEDVRTLAGETVTLSFYAKASENLSLANRYEQKFGSGGSADNNVFQGLNITTSWDRYSFTFTLASVSGKTIGAGSHLEFQFLENSSLADYTLDIWGVQLEAGSVATPFKRHAPSLQGELAACQRYYQKIEGDAFGSSYAAGYIATTTSARVFLPLSTTLRANPTMVVSGTATISFDGTALTPASYSNLLAQANGLKVHANVTGAVGNHACSWNLASGVIELSAEL